MKSSSLKKDFFCFTTKTGIKGIAVRTEYEKRRMQETWQQRRQVVEEYEEKGMKCIKHWGD